MIIRGVTHAPSDPSSRAAAVRDVWDEQSVWSGAANSLKARIGRARSVALVLGATAAVLGTAAAQTMAWNHVLGSALAFASAMAAGAAPLVASRPGPAAVAQWTRMRSVSEAMKNEVFTFLAGVHPYRAADAEARLAARLERLREDASDLLAQTVGVRPVQRELPAVTDVGSYVEHRLLRQTQDYYRPRAEHMRRRLVLVRRLELCLGLAGVTFGALAGTLGWGPAAAWVAVTAMLAAALSAHAQASKYEYQQIEFVRTADQLHRLLVAWRRRASASDEVAEDAFVSDCEQVISVLNDAWMAKWNVG